MNDQTPPELVNVELTRRDTLGIGLAMLCSSIGLLAVDDAVAKGRAHVKLRFYKNEKKGKKLL